MRLTVLAGHDAAPFLLELVDALGDDDALTVVAPTARDQWAHGLKRCPDLDALLVPRGEASPTYAVADAVAALGVPPAWWRPSDAEVARHVVRTELLGAGFTLTEATVALAARLDLPYDVLPASDDRSELHGVVEDAAGRRAVHVEELLAVPVAGATVTGSVVVSTAWTLTSQAAQALRDADAVVLAPGSRRLALDPLLATPGLVDALGDVPVLAAWDPTTPEPDLPALEPAPVAPRAQDVGPDAAAVVAAVRSLPGDGS